jgi:hypothetical protein
MLMGGTGTYQVTISAPGYTPANLRIQVSGSDPGCNTCGNIETQHRSIVLVPTA